MNKFEDTEEGINTLNKAKYSYFAEQMKRTALNLFWLVQETMCVVLIFWGWGNFCCMLVVQSKIVAFVCYM